jgi:hypothetical protein
MKKALYLLLTASCLLCCTACDDLMDTHKEFIEGGEVIYAPKPDTLFFVAGKNRIQANYTVSKVPSIESINIYWNNYADSLIRQIDAVNEPMGSIIIDNLDEKSYTFDILIQDKYGHRSLKVSEPGTAYGDIFQSSLLVQRINNMQNTEEGGLITWDIAQEGLVFTEFRYTDTAGKEQRYRIDGNTRDILCPDVNGGSSVDYRSAYLPEEACIDTFYTDWYHSADMGMNFPHQYTYQQVDRSNWEILFFDNNDPGEGSPDYLIDNNAGTYWHSNYHDPTQYPYTFVIDMKERIFIGRTGAMSRQNNYYSKGISFYQTDDPQVAADPYGSSWEFLNDLELQKNNNWQWSTVPENVVQREKRGRYLKVVMTNGYNGHLGAIAELGVEKISTIDGVTID